MRTIEVNFLTAHYGDYSEYCELWAETGSKLYVIRFDRWDEKRVLYEVGGKAVPKMPNTPYGKALVAAKAKCEAAIWTYLSPGNDGNTHKHNWWAVHKLLKPEGANSE